ncbi:MAG: hypothetical protein ISS34_07885, partial [Candidatus Omnitrophica bacterium]|nr:hypothetical protein [Candidatus Omnitrophota bacterium]
VLMGEADPDSVAITATDLMLRAISSDKVMSNQWLNNLNIITAGSIFPDPAKLFNSDKATKTLEYMKSKYDIVMLDTSPILAVSEPSIIASRVDEILLVFRAGVTSRFSLRMAKNQIESAKGKGSLSGIIINSMTPSIGKYGYYYYGKYGEYYSKKHDMA